MATVSVAGEQRILLEQVSWEAYEALLKSWADRPIRMTYDTGRLEIMSPLLPHEQYRFLLARLIETFTLEREIQMHGGGSMTFRSEALQRGLEPDECYWIQSEARMRLRKDFDLQMDPPPDLAIEVDITSSSLDRMSIYADLGVPEVWRFDGETFSINLLRESGRYEQCERGLALPELSRDVVTRFLQRSSEVSNTNLLLEFKQWIRDLAKGARPSGKSRRPPKK